MKTSIITLILLFFFGDVAWTDDLTQPLSTQKEKESYSIGYQVGRSMMADELEIDFTRLAQGLQDAVKENTPLLSAEEMKSFIVDLKTKARAIQIRKKQEDLAKNSAESEKFLAENKNKDGVKTTDSGLQYQVLEEGDGVFPTLEDYVKVHYKGTFIDGTEFDNSKAKGEPQTVKVDDVIKGWTETLQMMKVGSAWRVFVPPDLAYGRGGLGVRIPGNKVLVFEMELLSIEETDTQGEELN